MQKSKLLELWLNAYGHEHPLSDEWRVAFIRSAETRLICEFPDAVVERAVTQRRKLVDILEFARSSQSSLPSPAPNRASVPVRAPDAVQGSIPARTPAPAPIRAPNVTKAPASDRSKSKSKSKRRVRPLLKDEQPVRERAGRSRLTGSVWQPPVKRDEARLATVEFDKQDRQYP